MSFSKNHNKNRGYFRLDVWVLIINLYKEIFDIIGKNPKIDYRIKSQILNSMLSVSANISEGYSRRSVNEYIQFLYRALSSLSEFLTRLIALEKSNRKRKI